MKIPTPDELKLERARSLEADVNRVVEELAARLRADESFRAEARERCFVVAIVEERMRAAGWCVLVQKGGARDNGATDGIVVSATPIRCPSCGGRGSFTDERGIGDGNNRCSACKGAGGVR